MEIPRCEHPNPQWERKSWLNLNGEWEFDFDFGRSARERKLYQNGSLSKKIIVPFCPESTLSGIGHTDFIPSVCYRRVVSLSEQELNGLIYLHFGAVDYHSYIYVNGEHVGEHIGGYASFKIDITSSVHPGDNTIFVIAEDDTRSIRQPSGKQSIKYESCGCRYTRTTGIWQTVWLEFVPKAHIIHCKYYPDIANGTITITGEVSGSGILEVSSSYKGKATGCTRLAVGNNTFQAQIVLSELHLWEIGHGRLYDLEFRFGDDVVKSYFGMREVSVRDNKFLLNNNVVFLRMVLDQGFYPDGIYTAKDDTALQQDITLSTQVGFHGARLHQKVFEKRFIYHCDKAGYLIWGEHADCGMDYTDAVAQGNFICEWTEILERDFNSPALIGWCPFNETWGYREGLLDFRLLESVYKITKLYDKTRPCIDTSGNYHIKCKEIHDVHDYGQDPAKVAESYSKIAEGIINDQISRNEKDAQPYRGEPVFISEYGGIAWIDDASTGWGYGNTPKTLEEFIERYCALADVFLSNPYIMGICYTQLYDIEQEKNGLYYYDRSPKFNDQTMTKLKSAMTQIAAIEK